MDLKAATYGYLEAEGFEVEEYDNTLLVGRRAGVGSDERIYVWVPSESPAAIERRLKGFIGRFAEVADKDPRASKFFLTPGTAGLTADFRRTANYLSVKVVGPAQFFDTDMKWERSDRQTVSATQDLLERGRKAVKERAPQPFSYSYGTKRGDDLLPFLVETLRDEASKPVHFVVGPAGMGKSYLFDALFAQLYEAFIYDKRRNQLSRRPFPLLPDHLRGASAATANVNSILNDFLETDFARPLTRQVFEWRLINGSAVWLIDGLDEVIARDEDFFTTLFELETAEVDANPKILICVRDSLLSTDPALRDFCSYHEEAMDLYRLEPWERESIVSLTGQELEPRQAHEFLETVAQDESLQHLTTIPFYLSILIDEYQSGELVSSSEQRLIERALDRLLDREYEKGLLARAALDKDDVMELLETLAGEDYEADLRGIDVPSIRYNAEIVLQESVSSEEVDRFVRNLTHFALFSRSGEGRVRFVYDVFEQFLLGKHIARGLDNDMFFRRLNTQRPIPQDWVSWLVVADAVRQRNRQGALLPYAHENRYKGSFANLIRLAAVLGPEDVPLSEMPLEGGDLSGVSFEGVDFTGTSFRSANLGGTVFDNCILVGADFKGAVFDLTRFVNGTEEQLVDADFGDLDRFESIEVGGRTITDHASAHEWISEVTARRSLVKPPCPAAQQVKALFGKYVDAHGQARRSWLPSRALVRGARHHDPDEALKAAIRTGYLLPEGPRDKVKRPEGDRYSEMVQFRVNLTISPGIRELLDEICDPSCRHVFS